MAISHLIRHYSRSIWSHITGAGHLPSNFQENVNKEYGAGHNGYQGKATLKSDLREQKGIGLIEGNDKLWVLAFPEVVVVADAGDSPAASLCDIIQYRQSDGGVRIISPDDAGRCISYYRFKPMLMDLNGDGYQDLIFFPVFEQPQIGGEYDTVQALLYDPKARFLRFLCFSQQASGLVHSAPNDDPKKLHDYMTSYLRKYQMTLECDKQ